MLMGRERERERKKNARLRSALETLGRYLSRSLGGNTDRY